MAARAFKIFGEKQEDSTGGGCENINNDSEIIQALRTKSISPWSWKFFELVRLKAEKGSLISESISSLVTSTVCRCRFKQKIMLRPKDYHSMRGYPI